MYLVAIAYPRLACHPSVPQALDHLRTGQENTTNLCCRIILKTWQACESFWKHSVSTNHQDIKPSRTLPLQITFITRICWIVMLLQTDVATRGEAVWVATDAWTLPYKKINLPHFTPLLFLSTSGVSVVAPTIYTMQHF